MLILIVVVGVIFCAVAALRAARLQQAALWLAVTSVLLTVILYALDASEIAVIELSVGAGLVTVLFIFALNMISPESVSRRSGIPQPLVLLLALVPLVLLAAITLPFISSLNVSTAPILPAGVVLGIAIEPTFAVMLWQQRGLDALLQAVLIFTGTLSVLGLLANAGIRARSAASAPVISTPTEEPVVVEAATTANPLEEEPEEEAEYA
ncbi:MAG: hypothetical protein KF726_23595 [Anaerolineae bacterium]|nr:hypothetical protein [Anaerolineae bacterium]